MAGEESAFIQPYMGILSSVMPILQIVFLLAIVGLVMFIVWKRKPGQFRGAQKVLIKHRRGKDFTPEWTDGIRNKNSDGMWGYKLRNGDWVPAALFKDMRNMGKTGFLEVWETEKGKYMSAPSPFETERTLNLCPKCGAEVKKKTVAVDDKTTKEVWTCDVDGDIDKPFNTTVLTGVIDNRDEFTQNDLNWLVDNHKTNIKMYEKKNLLKEWLPIIVPAVVIIITVMSLVIVTTQVWIPLTDKASGIASQNVQYMSLLQNVTQMWFNQTSGGVTVIAGG